MRVTRILITAAALFALAAPNALADECGAETVNGQSGPYLGGAGSHVYMLLSQYEEDGKYGFEKHNLFDLRSNGKIGTVAAPFNGAAVRGAALATSGDRVGVSWWTSSGQQALASLAGGPFASGAAVSPAAADVSDPYGGTTDVAVAPDGSGVIIDALSRVHRVIAGGVIGPAFDAGGPTTLAINPNGTAWFARSGGGSTLVLYRWDAGAPAPVAVPVSVPFGVSYDLSAVADGIGGVRLVSNAGSGVGLIHARADGTFAARRFAGTTNGILRGRGDGTFALSTLSKSKGSGIRSLVLRAGKADDSLTSVTVAKGRKLSYGYDFALQPGNGALVTYSVNKGRGQLRLLRVKGRKLGKTRTIKAKTSNTAFDSPSIATTTSGAAWVLFVASDHVKHDSVCSDYDNYRYVAARVSSGGKVSAPKRVPGARPLYYYVGG